MEEAFASTLLLSGDLLAASKEWCSRFDKLYYEPSYEGSQGPCTVSSGGPLLGPRGFVRAVMSPTGSMWLFPSSSMCTTFSPHFAVIMYSIALADFPSPSVSRAPLTALPFSIGMFFG